MKPINPFQTLYITEKISPEDYVGVVSPFLVEYALKIFSQGNVVVLGTQGSGKTTLLALLKPEIRKEYGEKFPVPKELSDFISPGINFSKSGILDIGRRPLHSSQEEEKDIFPLLFADFFNYYICIDLLSNVRLQDSNNNETQKKFQGFINCIKKEDCWFGYLDDVNSYDDLIIKMKQRRSLYREFHQFNLKVLPESIENTKTAIGEPISRVARGLKEYGIISPKTNVFVRVDQLEALLDTDELRGHLGTQYRRMLNSALDTRDGNVSYKIGCRTYAWRKELRTYNSEAKLEESRAYTVIDVDDLLRRRENQAKNIFPAFARDVFYRRLAYFNLVNNSDHGIFDKIFGKSHSPDELAQKYCNNPNPVRALKIPEDFPKELQDFLTVLCKTDPLDAILATAWLQQGKKKNHRSFRPKDYTEQDYPWTKQYWQKERIQLALLQLASNCNQSMIWGGAENILALGNTGILCFLDICQHIWDTYIRTIDWKDYENHKNGQNLYHETIDISIQSLGIFSASKQWYLKIAELPNGHERQKLIDALGIYFRQKLLADSAMSYPGHTGFSLKTSDIESDKDLQEKLQDATDYGVLYEVGHTSKERNKLPRKKWYINSIYCPYMKIYAARIKEPYYTTTSELGTIIAGHAEVRPVFEEEPSSMSLFGEDFQ